MKSRIIVLTSLLGAGLIAGPGLFARGGAGGGFRGGNGGVCPYGNTRGSCGMYQGRSAQGTANRGATNPNRTPKQDGTGGKQENPNRTPKQDGTGGPGKPANPSGPQDGSGPGPRG